MLSENLIYLRKLSKLSQEEVAEKVGVSRQTLAKWERGESEPDLSHCKALADFYDVKLDELVNCKDSRQISPKGKYVFGAVTVGERGQIVIPKKARDLFHITYGSKVLLLGDDERGIALIPEVLVQGMFDILMGKGDWENHE